MKKAFLLFEILIALSLMAILTSLLFSFLAQSMKVEKKMEKARHAILERQNLQIRLQDLFSAISLDSFQSPLYTQSFPKEPSMSLVIRFDNGIDPDPQFSGSVLGRIYIDENKDLSLVYWPNDDSKGRFWRKETLLSQVSDFSFQFLSSHEMVEGKTCKQAPVIWDSAWPKEKRKTPSMTRLILKQRDATLQFAFHFASALAIPTWREP